uniref:Ovule protein n=1 Tax=Caenorhabditis tropicalis TaxID=1561998 RepID=A0A1I7U8D2_9PELO
MLRELPPLLLVYSLGSVTEPPLIPIFLLLIVLFLSLSLSMGVIPAILIRISQSLFSFFHVLLISLRLICHQELKDSI